MFMGTTQRRDTTLAYQSIDIDDESITGEGVAVSSTMTAFCSNGDGRPFRNVARRWNIVSDVFRTTWLCPSVMMNH